MTYHYRNKYVFRPDLSGPGLTGNELITMPHPSKYTLHKIKEETFKTVQTFHKFMHIFFIVIMGLLLATNVDKRPMLPLIDRAIGNLFHNPKDGFYTGRVMDMLFDGVPIDCHSDDTITAALCSHLQNQKSFKKLDTHHFTFSLFGGVNVVLIFKCFVEQFTIILYNFF